MTTKPTAAVERVVCPHRADDVQAIEPRGMRTDTVCGGLAEPLNAASTAACLLPPDACVATEHFERTNCIKTPGLLTRTQRRLLLKGERVELINARSKRTEIAAERIETANRIMRGYGAGLFYACTDDFENLRATIASIGTDRDAHQRIEERIRAIDTELANLEPATEPQP
jgi:hypothetical protein